jgi:acetolactate synthase-like protein
MARGLLGKGSKLQMRQCRKDALKEADVVILAGN